MSTAGLAGTPGQAPVGPREQTPDRPRRIRAARDGEDRAFRVAMTVAGSAVLTIMVLIGLFLAVRAAQALREQGWSFFTTQVWLGDRFGIAAVLPMTIVIALTAMVFAVPMSIGLALFVAEYSPRRFRRGLTTLVDLMAAVPSVVYGLWGALFLQEHASHVARFLSDHLGWIPLFKVHGVDHSAVPFSLAPYSTSSFLAGMVVAMMVIPIATSVMREAFSQAPPGEREAAFALGSTRWGMLRSVVLPFGRGAMVGGLMLGLGRALGETIAVVLVISPEFVIKGRILESGSNSIASLIALRYGEASGIGLSALMAAGLVLFAMTLLVNLAAAEVVRRSRSGAQTD